MLPGMIPDLGFCVSSAPPSKPIVVIDSETLLLFANAIIPVSATTPDGNLTSMEWVADPGGSEVVLTSTSGSLSSSFHNTLIIGSTHTIVARAHRAGQHTDSDPITVTCTDNVYDVFLASELFHAVDPRRGATLGLTLRRTGTSSNITVTGAVTSGETPALSVVVSTGGARGAAKIDVYADGTTIAGQPSAILAGAFTAATVALPGVLDGLTLNIPNSTYIIHDFYEGTVAQLADLSGGGAHQTMGTAATQPIVQMVGGQPGIQGKGAQYLAGGSNLPAPGTTPFWVGYAARQDAWTINAGTCGAVGASNVMCFRGRTATPYMTFFNTGNVGDVAMELGATFRCEHYCENSLSNGDFTKVGAVTVTGAAGNSSSTGYCYGAARNAAATAFNGWLGPRVILKSKPSDIATAAFAAALTAIYGTVVRAHFSPPTPTEIYISICQSNNDGHGDTALIPPAEAVPDYRSGLWETLPLTPWFQIATEWLPNYARRSLYGWEIYGLKALANAGRNAAVIKFGEQGTGIVHYWDPLANLLFPQLLTIMANALAALPSGSFVVKGLVIIGGEADADNAAYAAALVPALERLIDGVRTFVGNPNLPVFISRLNPAMYPPYLPIVYADQTNYPATHPNTYVVDTDSLTLIPSTEPIHFDSPSTPIHGQLIAAQILAHT